MLSNSGASVLLLLVLALCFHQSQLSEAFLHHHLPLIPSCRPARRDSRSTGDHYHSTFIDRRQSVLLHPPEDILRDDHDADNDRIRKGRVPPSTATSSIPLLNDAGDAEENDRIQKNRILPPSITSSISNGKGAGGGSNGGGRRKSFRGVRTCLSETDATGRFIRSPSSMRHWIGQDPKFAPQADRYHLYVSLACPWSTRVLTILYLKGLDNVISVSIAHPTWQRTRPADENDSHIGWVFRTPHDPPLTSATGQGRFDCEGCIADWVNGARTVRQLYELARDVDGKYSVPVLWDKRLQTIVNNESKDIMRILNTQFNDWAMNPFLDLYPGDAAAEIDYVSEWIYECINDGVYKCGFAKSQIQPSHMNNISMIYLQEAYNEAAETLFEGLDHAELILSEQRYLVGDRLTEADIKLFQSLIRFDEVYHTYFKCNRKRLVDYPNLLNYTREIFQMPGVSLSVNFNHIRAHYYSSHPSLNPFGIVPSGPQFLQELYRPHDRNRFKKGSHGIWG